MYFTNMNSVFFIFAVFISLLFQVVVSNSDEGGLQESNKKEIPVGFQGGKDIPITKANYAGALINRGEWLQGTVTILDDEWVLTSAINIFGVPQGDILTVRVGSSKYLEEGTLHNVSKIVTHPLYILEWDYNVSLLKLEPPIKISKKAKKIKISSVKVRSNGSKAKLVAFSGGPNNVGQLQEVRIPIIHFKKCRKFDVTKNISALNFCSAINGAGPCIREAGSPVVQHNRLIGIYTESYGCGDKHFPTVYADVTRVKSWIYKTIHDN